MKTVGFTATVGFHGLQVLIAVAPKRLKIFLCNKYLGAEEQKSSFFNTSSDDFEVTKNQPDNQIPCRQPLRIPSVSAPSCSAVFRQLPV
jgi:hypothetical protein